MKKIFHAAYALIASGMLVCPVQNASAVAAYPGIQRAFLADGTSISYRVVGDEYSHAFVSADGFFLERDENGIMSIKGEANVEEIMEKGKTMRVRQNIPGPSFPTTGNLRGVVLMVEFSDNSFVDGHDKELYDLIMNSERYSGGGATGSARDYLVDQSMGVFTNADMTDIGNSLDDFMTTSGWAGESVYQAGGRVMVGYYAKSGTLQSPAFDFGGSEEATIGFSVVSYPGKSVNYSLSLVDASDSREIEKYEGKATKTEENIVWHVGGLPEKVKCIFDTRNERAYFDNLVLLKGNIADESVWNSGPELWTEDNVVATSFKVTGLREGRSYACTVEAWSSDGLYPSCPSEEIVVVTGDNGGVEDLESGVSSEVVATIYYDVLGRRYSHSLAGTTIIKVTVYSDGSRKTEKNLTSSMLF